MLQCAAALEAPHPEAVTTGEQTITAIVLANEQAIGLDALIAGVLKEAAEDAAKAAVLRRMDGTVLLTVIDAETDIGLTFAGHTVTVSEGTMQADVRLAMPAESLLTLAALPRWGLIPRFTDAAGRAFYRQLFTRQVRIGGVRHVRLLRQLMEVLAA